MTPYKLKQDGNTYEVYLSIFNGMQYTKVGIIEVVGESWIVSINTKPERKVGFVPTKQQNKEELIKQAIDCINNCKSNHPHILSLTEHQKNLIESPTR